MTRWIFVKTVTPLILFSILLPLVDMGSDIRLIAKFYEMGHIKYATILLIPLLLNYIICFVKWYEWEPSKDRRKTFIFPLLYLFEIYGQLSLREFASILIMNV